MIQKFLNFFIKKIKHNNLSQNVSTPPYAHFYNPSVKFGCISFFFSSDAQKFQHLVGCQAIGINYLLTFCKCFTFFKFNLPSKKLDMNNNIRIIFLIISTITINIIMIYTKNITLRIHISL